MPDHVAKPSPRLVNLMAALLHDIGKFRYLGLSANEKMNHAELGAQFIKTYFSRFVCLSPFIEDIAQVVATHHSLVNTAPLEQANHFDLPTAQPQKVTESTGPLMSVFSAIRGSDAAQAWFLKPTVLKTPTSAKDLESLIKPNSGIDKQDFSNASAQLWENFLMELACLPDNIAENALIDSVYYLLWKYTSRIPAGSVTQRANIPLFDHLRLTAAISDALFGSQDAQQPLLLIEGDISGIQDFIYRLAEPDAKEPKMAKRLRGRSTYLTILAETVSGYILEQLELFYPNLIINGGGHFLIIAPNVPEIQTKLQQIEKEINKQFYLRFEGQLSLLLAWQPLTLMDLKNYSTSVKQLGMAIANQKSQKYLSVLTEIAQTEPAQPKDICAICHNDCLKSPCELCKETLAFGSELVYANYLVRVKSPNQKLSHQWTGSVSFELFQECWIPVRDDANLKNLLISLSKDQVAKVTVLALNPVETSGFDNPLANLNPPYDLTQGFLFVGNYAPKGKDGNVFEFEELTKLDAKGQLHKDKGDDIYKMLGVLRMDIDNLGQVFERLKTLPIVACMSREMHFLFTAPVNYLAREKHLYVTYSGGDDLFVLGRWNYCIAFAQELQKWITDWASQVTEISISGAIFMCKPTFPIRNAVALAKELLEDKAKHYRADGKAKDACYLFEDVYHWEKIKELLVYGKELENLMVNQQLPRSFAHTLLTLCKKYNPENQPTTGVSTKWVGSVKHLIHYALARRGVNAINIDKDQKGELKDPEKEKVNVLVRLLEPELFKRLRIPTSYALYKTRDKQTKKEEINHESQS